MTHQGIGQASGAVAQLLQGLVEFLLVLLNVHGVSSRLSGHNESSYAREPFFYTFFWAVENARSAGVEEGSPMDGKRRLGLLRDFSRWRATATFE